MSTKREAAHAAARLGFDVFPVTPNDKKPPLIANWQNLATQDPKQIDAWWTEWPDANIATTTNTRIVVDLDPRNGGKPTFEMLSLVEDWPKTAVSSTAGGGNHVFYAAPEGRPVKGGTHKLGPGVDVKARGGYVVLPGSTIGDRAYQWANNNPIARAPQWIVEQCKTAKDKPDNAGTRIVEEDDIAIELATQWMLNHAPTAEHGNIDDTTYAVAARLYDFGVSVETATDIMLEWNDLKCNPPGDLERLPVVVESASINRANTVGARHPLAPGFEATEIAERAPLAAGTPTTKPAHGMHLETYFEAAAKALSSQAEPLVKGILDRAAMSIVYGESNTGKTFIAVDIGFYIAAGMSWAKRKTRQGAVVYVAAEGGVGVYKRLAALRKHYPDIPDVPFFIIRFPVDLLHGAEHGKQLVTLCQEAAARAGLPLELVVIDTLSRAMSGGDENSSTDMGAMVKSFDALRQELGAHLMVVHHSGKDRAKGARGHSLLRAATDTEIEIARNKITVTKQRDMDGFFSQGFKLASVPIGRDADGAPVSSCVVELLSHQEAADLAVAPTKAEAALLARIKNHLRDDIEKVFGWQLEAAMSGNEVSDIESERTNLSEMMKSLSDKGCLVKLKRNQYVLA